MHCVILWNETSDSTRHHVVHRCRHKQTNALTKKLSIIMSNVCMKTKRKNDSYELNEENTKEKENKKKQKYNGNEQGR